MQTPRLLALAALGVMTIAFARDVTTDYDHKVDFGGYHTYSWIGVQAGDNLWADRIRADVDAELAAKGWTRVASGGDAAVSAFGKVGEQQTLQTFYNGFPGWNWGGFDTGTATTTVIPEKTGTLVTDIFDARTKKLIWRAVATDTLSKDPEHNQDKLKDAVKDMFKHFPPKSKD